MKLKSFVPPFKLFDMNSTQCRDEIAQHKMTLKMLKKLVLNMNMNNTF